MKTLCLVFAVPLQFFNSFEKKLEKAQQFTFRSVAKTYRITAKPNYEASCHSWHLLSHFYSVSKGKYGQNWRKIDR